MRNKIDTTLKTIALSIIALLTFCSFSQESNTVDLLSFFQQYPILKETNQINFSHDDTAAYLKEGWSWTKEKESGSFQRMSGSKASIQAFFRKKRNITMQCQFRSNQDLDLEVHWNDKQISQLTVKKGKNTPKIEIPDELVLSGLNQIDFTFSRADKSPELKPPRLDFQDIKFLPEENGSLSDLVVQAEKKLLQIQGPLSYTSLLRTYPNSQIKFKIRSRNIDPSEDQLKMIIETASGEVQSHVIDLNENKWEEKKIDLGPYGNQVIKLTFQHFCDFNTLTEIQKPLLIKGAIPEKNRKILLFGLDGATWEIIYPLLEQNKLPHLKKLIKSGASGRLRSVRPMYSPLIWTSMMTGKVVDKHGITGFLDQKTESFPNSSFNRNCLALWNILSAQDKVVGIVGPWVTWPAEKVNGYLLSDRIYFNNLFSTAFPAELEYTWHNKIKNLAQKGTFIKNSVLKELESSDFSHMRSPVQDNIKQEKMYLNQDHLKKTAGLYLNPLYDPDLFFLYLRGPDVSSHFFWKYYEPDENVLKSEEQAFSNLIPQIYMYADSVLGEFLERHGKETTIIIVSDHGMTKKSYAPQIVFDNIEQLWATTGIQKNIRRSQTKRYTIELFFTNKQQLLKAKTSLDSIRYADKGSPFFLIEEHNKNSSLVLEINDLFKLDENRSLISGGKILGKISEFLSLRELSGDHVLHGILIVKGPDINQNIQLDDYSVLDILPTILYLMDLPVAKDIDGDIIFQAISDRYIKNNPVRFTDTYENNLSEKDLNSSQPKRNKEIEKQLKERLKSLGYIK